MKVKINTLLAYFFAQLYHLQSLPFLGGCLFAASVSFALRDVRSALGPVGSIAASDTPVVYFSLDLKINKPTIAQIIPTPPIVRIANAPRQPISFINQVKISYSNPWCSNSFVQTIENKHPTVSGRVSFGIFLPEPLPT